MSETKNSLLRAEQLTVGYEGVPVVGPVDLEIRKGEIFTLIGPNGAGKTTLLKTLAHQLEPVAGTVFLNEEEIAGRKPTELAKEMAVVFSNALKPDRMTCKESVAVGRYPYTGRFGTLSDEDEAVIQRSMEQVHVADLADRSFDAISDGQRQRVVLARALCQEPDILLLDEPTTFLDIRWKAEFLKALRDLSENDGLTVVLTLHELDLAQKVSDRVACVRGHTLDRVGTPEKVFSGTYIADLFELDPESYRRWFE
ncbi:MAG: ABC transporter ATP-binding protein [Clostridia bacterium]|nr:ABC transporter ATP-binding protein [Clostridia bacterium]